MRVTYPVSTQVLIRTDVSDTHVMLPVGYGAPDYIEALLNKQDQGHELVLSHRDDTPLSAYSDSCIHWDDIVTDIPGYLKASSGSSDRIFMGTASDGSDRLALFNRILQTGIFNPDKEYWLYGVPEPAELGMYRRLFTAYACSRITMAVCSSCFIYSVYGARFSVDCGRLEKLPGVQDHLPELGFTEELIKYSMCREQLRVFFRNQEVVQSFAEGAECSRYVDMLELEGVV